MNPETTKPILQLTSLTKRFGKRVSVNDVNLEVYPGQVYGFLGPNGAGKSTTIRMIFGLIKPNAGSVKIFDKDLIPSNRGVLTDVGGIIESPDFYKYLTAKKNLQILGEINPTFDIKKVDEALDMVGLLGRANDLVKTFSHGMKQRLGLAQALMTKPKLLVLDEPTTGLDPAWIKQVREIIIKLASEEKITIFLSSHLLSEVEQVATHAGIISEGKIIIQGAMEELLTTAGSSIKIKVSNTEKATALLSPLDFVDSVEATDGSLLVKSAKDSSGEINRVLVEGGITVSSLQQQTPLEEYFLSITGGVSDA